MNASVKLKESQIMKVSIKTYDKDNAVSEAFLLLLMNF